MREYAVVGQSLPRVDALEKATGSARYGADLFLPGMLHGKVLRSPYPHARILRIDTSRAERLKGVRGVITGWDGPGIQVGFIPQGQQGGGQVPLVSCQAGLSSLDPRADPQPLTFVLLDPLQLGQAFEVDQVTGG